jgi:hypothetical protein
MVRSLPSRTHLLHMRGDREARQDQEHYASITRMIRHYVARRAKVTEGHRHNAAIGVASLAKGCVLSVIGQRPRGRRWRGRAVARR